MKRKQFGAALLIVVNCALALASQAVAAEPIVYNQAAFDQAQADSKRITLLDFFSTRCSSCTKQAAILKKLLDEPKFKSIQWFQVVYEGTPTPMTQKYEIDHSSLIVFRGNLQVERGLGHMDEPGLRKLLASTIKTK